MGAYPTTHVANGCQHPIWVMCDTDRQHTIGGSVTLGNANIDLNNVDVSNSAIEAGMTKISPGNYLGFKPKIGIGGANWINRNTVYITIDYEDQEGKMHTICRAFPKASNESVIVARDYTVRATKMGEIWIDTSGANHRPNAVADPEQLVPEAPKVPNVQSQPMSTMIGMFHILLWYLFRH
ncbi:unnamed protein product [Rotaria socialis]|uniref:Uncharacterized protein n=2 Tax=Rotaria socialis TaxID=392032 RepID=A0A817WDF5_9BILA|nr:unnamed protein product [Rotaria socialis]CAF4545489.1 unnamed protein product [Rotaria socialis]